MHVLFSLYVIFLLPLIGYAFARKARKRNVKKEHLYLAVSTIYIGTAAVSAGLASLSNLTRNQGSPPHAWVEGAAIGIAAFLILTKLLPAILLPFSKSLQDKVRESYDDTRYPSSAGERKLFLISTGFVGVAEELAYWGFLQHYVSSQFQAPADVTLILIAALFGAGHFHQGVTGIINSTWFGFLMGYLYFQTGTILIPILIHVLFDMRMVLISFVLFKKKPV